MLDKKKIGRALVVPAFIGLLAAGIVVAFVFYGSFAGASGSPDDMPGHHNGAVAPYAAPVVGLEEAVEESEAGRDAAPACDFSGWVGHPVDKAALKATRRPHRILPPGSMATMDYSAERINVHTDDEGIVTKVDCG